MLYIYFRQVHPSPNNLATGSLSENAQLRNIRRVKVNAQVAFCIYLFEILSAFSMIFVWLFIGKQFISKTASILLYYVLLPYIYLTNTSDNENRIIDEGWSNTFRNTLGISTNDMELTSQSHEETTHTQTSRYRPNHSKKYISSITGNKTAIGQLGENKQNSDVYTISPNTKETPTSQFDTENLITASEIQSCSCSAKGKQPAMEDKENRLQVNLEDGGLDDEDSSNPRRSRYLRLAETILFEMKMNINEEEVYIHYLKQLLVLENKTALDNFKIFPYNVPLVPKPVKVKTSKQSVKLRSNHDIVNTSKNRKPHIDELDVKFLGRNLDRLDLRKCLFENSQDYCKDE